ncbi:hypothetical protein GCM10023328_44210 [Modestobacter marinus]|uniref:Secreted protein n=1 Tax=Modestobacter marinus TaxID=477641 RepID=A0A846LXY6_9ACTN|nr:hypothetical protein [Modestobacter marinus]NIH68279.1 hypothetical protein [Modestobacter marinus]GGL55958.1 hypothetical protein GCM10011589_09980 [Modestobacter marinus]
MNARRITSVTAAAAAAVVLSTATASAATTVEQVHPSDLGGAWHTGDTRPDGSLDWSTTYGGALGTGAAVLSTPTSGAKVQLFTDAHDDTHLRDITELGYATFQAVAPSGSPALPSLNIRLDRDDDGDVDAYLVYEPYQDDAFYGNAAVRAGEWQTWDAWHDGQSQWWSGQIAECPQSTPCTIDRLLELYPDAVIQEDPVSLRAGSTPADADFNGSLGVNQGSGNAGVVGAADALHIATSTGVDVTYDFQPDVRLTGKDDCKDGGWATSTDPVFRNQGACVSHFTKQ